MINKEWLDKQEQLIVEYYNEYFLSCRLFKRAIHIEISKHIDDTNSTNIYFIENDIFIFHFWMDSKDDDLSKKLLTEWLINNISHSALTNLNENIHKEEIYDSYIQGEDAMIDYYWQDVKVRLQDLSKHIGVSKLIDALESYSNSPVLRKFIPYVSVGRLCLSKTTAGQPYSSDCLCLKVIDNRIEVASYEHKNVHLFDNVFEAIKYVEGFYESSELDL